MPRDRSRIRLVALVFVAAPRTAPERHPWPNPLTPPCPSTVQGSVSLFQVSGDPSAPEDQSLLLVSFEGAARGTIALAMASDGAALSQLEAPGVDAASPCIWAGGVPGGWGAQATAEGIRIAGPAPAWSLAFEWRSTQGEYTSQACIHMANVVACKMQPRSGKSQLDRCCVNITAPLAILPGTRVLY
jgi:hypothetical protein